MKTLKQRPLHTALKEFFKALLISSTQDFVRSCWNLPTHFAAGFADVSSSWFYGLGICMLTCLFVFAIGFLESLDDFYILSNGLILLQTTNSVYNKTLLKFVVPQSLLAWQRVRVANMMANGGKEWAEIFTKYNSGKCPVDSLWGIWLVLILSKPVKPSILYFMSPHVSGTYNNQYMVLDLKKVKPKSRLGKGTLYVVEQIPTYVEFSEQTDVLRKGTTSGCQV